MISKENKEENIDKQITIFDDKNNETILIDKKIIKEFYESINQLKYEIKESKI